MVLSVDYAGLLNNLLGNKTKYGGVVSPVSSKISGYNMLVVFIAALLIILIKGLIVYLAWNAVIPSIINSVKQNPEKEVKFRPITYTEALLFTILVLSLVR
jgi:uncharacterized membrane protein YjgN (DUF898 family)